MLGGTGDVPSGARQRRVGPAGNVVIQSLAPDTVSAAATVGTEWLESHANIVNGKTVFDAGREKQTLAAPIGRIWLAARARPKPGPDREC